MVTYANLLKSEKQYYKIVKKKFFVRYISIRMTTRG